MSALLSLKILAKPWIIIFFTLFLSMQMNAIAYTATDEAISIAQLSVTPKPCVALRKGQKCYLEVTFSWQHPKTSNYCLVNSTTNTIMKCWAEQSSGKFNFDFQSTMSNNFALREHASTVDIAITKIPVAWVYKSSKRAKATWRLF
ncbi:MAG: DUF3019 domain-containing protein [Glaciecola sp.]